MSEFNRQKTFNKAYRGLKAQGFKQAGRMKKNYDGEEAFDCQYRGDNGMKCAIGHCIPDSKYHNQLEGDGARSEKLCLVMGYKYGSGDAVWANDLQMIHDRNSQPELMQEALIAFAKAHELTVPAR